jgi:hypothetical protein
MILFLNNRLRQLSLYLHILIKSFLCGLQCIDYITLKLYFSGKIITLP